MKQKFNKKTERIRRKEEERQASLRNRKVTQMSKAKNAKTSKGKKPGSESLATLADAFRREIEKNMAIYRINSTDTWGTVSVSLDPGRNLTPEEKLERERDELKGRLNRANQKIEEQDEFLKEITEGALALGTVITVKDNRKGTVASGGQVLCCTIPEGAKPGDRVRIIPKSSQPVDVADEAVDAGEVCTVTTAADDILEIAHGTGSRTIARGGVDAQEGDRVVVDPGFHVALRNLGPSEKLFNFESSGGVTWDDIGGLESAKEALREAIEFPITHSNLFSQYGKQPSSGVLLYGPPGCGKTMLGKAAATALASRGSDGGFIYVKGPEILSMWVGEAESTVRALFRQAKSYKQKTGHAAVLFIDEAEAVLASRETSGFRGGVQSTLVPAFLAEMDGLEDSGAFVMLATNHPATLDSAITRDGRIDRKIEVSRPGREQTMRILELSTRGVPTSINLAEVLCREAFDRSRVVTSGEIGDLKFELLLSDIMSGALASGLVRRAVECAMRRDRGGDGTVSGVTELDAQRAVSDATKESAQLDWSREIIGKVGAAAKDYVIHKTAKAGNAGMVN